MAYQELMPYFEKLSKPEYKEYFLVISPKDHDYVYAQFTQISANEFYCEVVSNKYLPDKHKLNSTQIRKLTELGFVMEPQDVNYNQVFNVENEMLMAELSKLIIKVIVEIHGVIISGFDITFDV
ncbi:MAG: TY-Chap domain-containing protein [Candidatus Heimdallarchaeota archaeon]